MVASANPKDSADYSTFTIAPPPDPCAHQEFSAPAHAHNVAHLDSAISIVLAAVSLPAPFPSNPHRFDASPSRISISTLRHSGLSRMNNLTKRGLDFLDFLRSGETDIHAFAENQPKRRRAKAGQPF
jgi:hypothetical protein